jgi:Arc/MetJ-type ribon-helix-helix transcriptional regulator
MYAAYIVRTATAVCLSHVNTNRGRIPEGDLAALDEAVRAGRFASRAAAVREGVSRLLGEQRNREIAESYRRAYCEHPEDERFGEVGRALLAETVAAERELARGASRPAPLTGNRLRTPLNVAT